MCKYSKCQGLYHSGKICQTFKTSTLTFIQIHARMKEEFRRQTRWDRMTEGQKKNYHWRGHKNCSYRTSNSPCPVRVGCPVVPVALPAGFWTWRCHRGLGVWCAGFCPSAPEEFHRIPHSGTQQVEKTFCKTKFFQIISSTPSVNQMTRAWEAVSILRKFHWRHFMCSLWWSFKYSLTCILKPKPMKVTVTDRYPLSWGSLILNASCSILYTGHIPYSQKFLWVSNFATLTSKSMWEFLYFGKCNFPQITQISLTNTGDNKIFTNFLKTDTKIFMKTIVDMVIFAGGNFCENVRKNFHMVFFHDSSGISMIKSYKSFCVNSSQYIIVVVYSALHWFIFISYLFIC